MTTVRCSLVLAVREHAVFADRPGGGNTASTLEFIPGTALRGAMAQRYLRRGGSPTSDDFVEMFERSIRFLDGRLRIDGRRSAPVPLSARRCKTCGSPSRKDLVEANAGVERCLRSGCGGDFKSFSGWWVAGANGDDDQFRAVDTVFIGRTSIENGTAKEGSLRFSSCLPAGEQRFVTQLVGDADTIEILLLEVGIERGEYLRMGSASSVGGRFEIVEQPSLEEIEAPTFDDGAAVAVDLLARSILVDPWMRAVTVPEPPTGWRLARRSAEPWAYTSTEEVHGWNAGQQIPKPVDIAVAAGGVLVLTPDGNDHAGRMESLRGWLESGVGLRRAEGFGEVSFRPADAPSEASREATKP